MASSLIANPEINSERLLESKKKRNQKQNQQQTTRWRTAVEQQIYSSKLVEALRQVRRNPSHTASDSPPSGPSVREVTDRALAIAAKGRTRWSRAILANRLKLKLKKKLRAVTGNCISKKPRVSVLQLKAKRLPALQRRVRVLGRLVPGCRKLSLPVLLEEATDYIPALEMQVRAMTLLTLLTGTEASLHCRLFVCSNIKIAQNQYNQKQKH